MTNVSKSLKKLIMSRAQGYCEYCKSPADFTTEPFLIEHIFPRSRQGTNTAENLAYSCIGCNVNKSDLTDFLDMVSQEIVPLFNPRTMARNEHFI
jgi:5-methylcytosine-specific restriction endonuclease McrA